MSSSILFVCASWAGIVVVANLVLALIVGVSPVKDYGEPFSLLVLLRELSRPDKAVKV